jgi:hypothetical protein
LRPHLLPHFCMELPPVLEDTTLRIPSVLNSPATHWIRAYEPRRRAPLVAMAPPPAAGTKQTYRPTQKLEVFYTGGTARVTRDNKLIACTCGDEVKVRRRGCGKEAAPPFVPAPFTRAGASDSSRKPLHEISSYSRLHVHGNQPACSSGAPTSSRARPCMQRPCSWHTARLMAPSLLPPPFCMHPGGRCRDWSSYQDLRWGESIQLHHNRPLFRLSARHARLLSLPHPFLTPMTHPQNRTLSPSPR